MSFRAAPGTVNVKVLSVPGVPPLSFFVEGYPRTNLFMKVEVRDSNDNVLKTQTGADVLTFDYTIPTNGTYYVSIAGTGNGDPKTPPGFSTYGSRGQYQLTVAYVNGENVCEWQVAACTWPCDAYTVASGLRQVWLQTSCALCPAAVLTPSSTTPTCTASVCDCSQHSNSRLFVVQCAARPRPSLQMPPVVPSPALPTAL
jgi:hypothetical protein